MSARISPSQLHFLSLSTAIFCAQCELISASTRNCCSACGSKAILGLSRLLGGSLQGHGLARLIEDDELSRLVRQLLDTVPGAERDQDSVAGGPLDPEDSILASDVLRHDASPAVPQFALAPAIGAITERAQVLTGATGAAIALRRGDEVICRARAGRTAPDLGVHLQTDSGVSAECMRSGEVVLCEDAHSSPRADRATCERLGVRSILAAPLRQFDRTLGIFEVLSPTPNAFDAQDIATMQLLSSMMVTAITRMWRFAGVSRR